MRIKKAACFFLISAGLAAAFFVSAQSFGKDLYFGLANDSGVLKLQQFLAAEKLYSGPLTGNFFSLTREAVKKFQAREKIAPAAGYFGPKSRTRANAMLALRKTPETGVILEVPYIFEAPSGSFTGNWKNACEEASITMVEKYYLGEKSVGIKEAEAYMTMLFEKEDELYGSSRNTDAAMTAEIIQKYASYNAAVVTDPTVENIKKELDQKQPVISLHYGFGLQNKNLNFSPTLSSYHMMAIIGYDDAAGEFITNDDGDAKTGAGHRYGYDLFMSTLHDYDFSRNKTDGPARVIFTSSKVKTQ